MAVFVSVCVYMCTVRVFVPRPGESSMASLKLCMSVTEQEARGVWIVCWPAREACVQAPACPWVPWPPHLRCLSAQCDALKNALTVIIVISAAGSWQPRPDRRGRSQRGCVWGVLPKVTELWSASVYNIGCLIHSPGPFKIIKWFRDAKTDGELYAERLCAHHPT